MSLRHIAMLLWAGWPICRLTALCLWVCGLPWVYPALLGGHSKRWQAWSPGRMAPCEGLRWPRSQQWMCCRGWGLLVTHNRQDKHTFTEAHAGYKEPTRIVDYTCDAIYSVSSNNTMHANDEQYIFQHQCINIQHRLYEMYRNVIFSYMKAYSPNNPVWSMVRDEEKAGVKEKVYNTLSVLYILTLIP